MNDVRRAYIDDQFKRINESVRQAIKIAGGDVHHALRVAIIANTFLQEENDRLNAQVSKGFTRGRRNAG
jgi:hypothetical protein